MKASTPCIEPKKFGTPRLPKFKPDAVPRRPQSSVANAAAQTPAHAPEATDRSVIQPLKGLTVKDAAYRLNKSPDAVRWWLKTGRLKGWQPGGRGCTVLVCEQSLQKALECTPLRSDSQN